MTEILHQIVEIATRSSDLVALVAAIWYWASKRLVFKTELRECYLTKSEAESRYASRAALEAGYFTREQSTDRFISHHQLELEFKALLTEITALKEMLRDLQGRLRS